MEIKEEKESGGKRRREKSAGKEGIEVKKRERCGVKRKGKWNKRRREGKSGKRKREGKHV